MKIDFSMQGTTLVVVPSGEIDHHTSVTMRERVDREFQKRRAKNIVFDFNNIMFMDSSGIGLLMGRYRTVAICGGSIALFNVKPKVSQMLELSGIYKLMKVYEDKNEALESLA